MLIYPFKISLPLLDALVITLSEITYREIEHIVTMFINIYIYKSLYIYDILFGIMF